MMKRLIFLLSFSFLLTTSCHSNTEPWSAEYESSGAVQDASRMKMNAPAPLEAVEGIVVNEREEEAQINNATEKKIIKTGGIRIQVEKLDESQKRVKELIKKYNAYIVSENTANTGGSLENNLVIRVKHDQFDALAEDIVKEAAYLQFKNIATQDVTEEFVDIEARLKTKKQVEARYRELLSQAKTVEDILKIENELRVIREEIEAREGRLKYLKDQVQYSTINLDMYQELAYQPSPKFNFFSRVLEALRKGWDGFVSFFVGLIYIWPFLILLGIVLYFIRKRWRLRKTVRKEDNKHNI